MLFNAVTNALRIHNLEWIYNMMCCVDVNLLVSLILESSHLIFQNDAFLQTKARSIKRTTEILKDKYANDIPNTVEDLCKLPGMSNFQPLIFHLIVYGSVYCLYLVSCA